MIEEKDSKVIGLDLDGVLADIASEFLKYVKEEYGLDFRIENIKSYDATEWSGMNHEQVEHIFCNTDIFETVRPLPFSIEATKTLKKAGWTIHIITFRQWHGRLKQITREWLKKNGFSYDALHLSEGHDKTNLVHEHGIKVFVEDRRESTESMSRMCDKVYLFDYPYNRGPIRENVQRVNNWMEIIMDLGLHQ